MSQTPLGGSAGLTQPLEPEGNEVSTILVALCSSPSTSAAWSLYWTKMHFPLCPYPSQVRHSPSLKPSKLTFFFFKKKHPSGFHLSFFSKLGNDREDSSCAFAQDSSRLWPSIGTALSEMEDVALPGAGGARARGARSTASRRALVMLCLHLEARPAQIEGEQKRCTAGDMRQNTFPFLGLQTPLLQQLGLNKAEE